ncbi:MAG: hypothetical protein ACTSU3_07725 [Candidatus Thorarchaeota archaeon]
MLYERLCTFGTKLNLNYGSKNNRDLEKAARFLRPMMSISAEGVISAARFVALLSFIASVTVLFLLNVNILIAISFALIILILSYFVVVSYPVSLMNSYKLSLSEEADIVFEQFILVFQSGGTIFDAIEMVTQSNHPYLSAAFKRMQVEINKGKAPEICLMEFAKNQPSDDLRRYFTGIISALEQKTEVLEFLSGESFEADLALRQKNLELESRLLIVAALVTYVPIMLTLAVSLSGFATNLAVILIAPLFILMNALFASRFAKQFSAYFDRPQSSGISIPSQKDIIEEYDEFLNFMILIGERLRLGDTLEVGLSEVRDDVGFEVQRMIDPAHNAIYGVNKGIEDAMNIAANLALGQRVANMLLMISSMCQVSAIDAGDRISKIATRLVKRSAVAKERDSIIAAQKLKVYLLSFTSAVVLGLLSSLAPFLNIGSILSGGPAWSPGSISFIDILPLVATLQIITISTGYMNTKMVNGAYPILLGLLCGLSFLISFQLSGLILGLSNA